MSGREGAGSPERQGEAKPGGILPALGAEVRGCFQGAFGHPTPCQLCHMGKWRRYRVWNINPEGLWGSLGALMSSLQALLSLVQIQVLCGQGKSSSQKQKQGGNVLFPVWQHQGPPWPLISP